MNLRRVAGDTVALCTLWLCWALLAPPVFEARAELHRAGPQHICPLRHAVHGVGGNLKTYLQEVDLCAIEEREE